MDDYNASDTRSIRRAKKAAQLADAQRREVVFGLMSTPGGRDWVWDILNRCHVFSSSFSTDQLVLAFNEGERNIGLTLLSDVMRAAPDQYIQMTREANDRHIAADRGHERSGPNGRRDDSGWPDNANGSGDEYVARDDDDELGDDATDRGDEAQ